MRHGCTALITLILMLPAPADQDAVAGGRAWHMDLHLEDGAAATQTPFSTEIDFDALLHNAGVTGVFAPQSVRVVSLKPDGAGTLVPHLMSEDFAWKNKGTVSWSIAGPEQRDFRVYFDIEAHGPYPSPAYLPLIGIGDNFRYNRQDGLDPLQAMEAGSPISADFDDDGLIDLVRSSLYGNTWGQPWFTICFWRNIGTNETPVYADFVRLYADGAPVDNQYNGCCLYDWDGDGKQDLITAKTVYRNTGEVCPSGVPVLTKLCDMPPMTVKGEPYCFFIGITDHDANGIDDAFYMYSSVHYEYEGPPPRNSIRGALYRKINSAGPGLPPIFDREEPILRNGELWTENAVPTGFCDLDHDGVLDCVGNTHPLDRVPSVPQYVYWPNTAPKSSPPVYGKAILIPNGQNTSAYTILQVDNLAYKGLFTVDGYRVRYHEFTGRTLADQMPGYKDRGLLMQQNARCAVQGFSGVDVVDWEGNGTWDLVSGDEFGFVWLIRNTGTNERPVFAPAEHLQADGNPIRIMRWHYVQDGNPEYYLGQTKPRCADWDGDGDLDLLCGNNTNRIVFFENSGTRPEPLFTQGNVLRAGDDELAFTWRCQPSIVDWDGDGLKDLITGDRDGHVCLFKRYRCDDALALSGARPFSGEDGNPFIAKNSAACDWDGDGDWDLLCQVGAFGEGGPALFENTGTNAEPRFKAPVRLKCWGKEITLSAHEHSFSPVDWYGTGEPDLVCGAECGWFYFFRRPALDAPAPPAARVGAAVETGRE